jgi:FtsP/CotA-like multicopper oxidase with cupredoxin domain
MMKRIAISALAVGVLVQAAPASALDVYLIAKELDKTLPDGSVVKMWGFAEDPGGACYGTTSGGSNSAASKAARMAAAACTGPVASVPGPSIVAPATVGSNAADRVRVRLVNLLDSTKGGEPISLVIPGQTMPSRGATGRGPTWSDGSFGSSSGGTPGTRRVRSFGRETVVDGGRLQYAWIPNTSTGLREGTYLYHSGTHPQVQVQMGLYGSITRNAVDGGSPSAYDGVAYDNEITVLYSEIDPALHAAVASGSYGTLPGPTSTFEYNPEYYLVNGEPFATKASATIPGAVVGERTLLRLLNAGLQLHSPTLQGMRMEIVAEDGSPYPTSRHESSAVLAPLKTKDAIVEPTVDGTYALYDGMLSLSNTDGSAGGLLSFLQVGAGTSPSNTAPVAVNDPATAGAYDVNQNNILSIAAPGVLANDTDAEGHPLTAALAGTNVSNGTLSLNADGSFVYTPNLGASGTDSFSYTASDGAAQSLEATATITIVAVANNAPVADDGSATTGQQLAGGNSEDVAITLTGSDSDGDALTFAITGGPSSGTLSGSGASRTYSPNTGFAGSDSFTFKTNDGTADSLVDGVVSITVNANQAPVADVDTATTSANTSITFNIVDNDSDPDPNGSIDATTVVIQRPTRKGTIVDNGDGTVTYTPNFDYTGSDAFRYRVRDDDGALSRNPGGGARTKVRINVVP